MSYKPKGMHAAATGEASAIRNKGETVRTILPRGRIVRSRLLDGWDLVPVSKAIVMPDSQESPTMPRISRKLRVSPLTVIAHRLKREWQK